MNWPAALAIEPLLIRIGLVVAGILTAAPLCVRILAQAGKLDAAHQKELLLRWRSWVWLAGITLGILSIGRLAIIPGVALLGLLCYREFAQLTGLDRDPRLQRTVIFGIATVAAANFTGQGEIFIATALLAAFVILSARLAAGKVQDCLSSSASALLAFFLFGAGFGSLGLIANRPDGRAILIVVLLAVSLNDVFAYCVGRAVGGPKLCPQISPGKTVAGALGALILTPLLVTVLSQGFFARLGEWGWVVGFSWGLSLSASGQLGDLIFSAIKRDLRVKDFGSTIAGHGGVLDRFDSLTLAGPVAYACVAVQTHTLPL